MEVKLLTGFSLLNDELKPTQQSKSFKNEYNLHTVSNL